MSLRLKLILVLLIALIFPVTLSQWNLLENFNQVQREVQTAQLQKSVDATVALFQSFQRDAAFNARLMAASGELDRYLKRSQYRLPEMTTYRALLKSWSVYLKHYEHYRQIAYVEKSGIAPVQFSLLQTVAELNLQDNVQFQLAAQQNTDAFIWYQARPAENTLSMFVAHGVTTFKAGDVVRRSNQIFTGYIIIRIDIDSSQLDSAETGTGDDLHAVEILLQGSPVVITSKQEPSAKRFHVEHPLDSDITIRSSMRINQINWLDPVLVRAGLLSLLQFAAAALIFFMIVHRWLVQPLQHGLALTQQLGEGKWLGKNQFPRKDEMGALIQSLHAMSDRLQQTTAELESKREQAELAERLKTEFLANISHEIRTPVNIIVGVINRLGRFVTEPRQKEYLESANSEAHKLVHQIDGLILLADLETKKHQLHTEEFYIPDLLQRAILPYQILAQQRQLTFDALIDDALNEVVLGDFPKITKVLDVLLSNAFKFTDQGGVEMSVRLRRAEEHSLVCEFSVRDTGCGIDAALIPTLGKAFAQGDGSLVRAHGGLGLGLAIAKGFLALMDSDLSVESIPGEGSRFGFVVTLQRSTHTRTADNFSI